MQNTIHRIGLGALGLGLAVTLWACDAPPSAVVKPAKDGTSSAATAASISTTRSPISANPRAVTRLGPGAIGCSNFGSRCSSSLSRRNATLMRLLQTRNDPRDRRQRPRRHQAARRRGVVRTEQPAERRQGDRGRAQLPVSGVAPGRSGRPARPPGGLSAPPPRSACAPAPALRTSPGSSPE